MRREILYGVGIFISTLFLYWLTSYPTVAYIDSGELALAAWTLGIAHPTGYPLYTLIGRLFSLLPFELITTQILLGMLCTSLAAVVLYFTLKKLFSSEEKWRSLTAAAFALLFAVAPLVWSQGTTNEVYSLQLLLFTLLLYLLSLQATSRTLLTGAFLYGLAFGNHMSTILLAPSVIAYLWHNRRYLIQNRRILLGSSALFLLGISIYFYLPIRSALMPLFNWDEPHTWANFVRHVSGWQYRVWMFHQSIAALVKQLGNFAVILYDQFPLPFWPAIVWGLFIGWKRHPRLQTYLALFLAMDLIYSLNFSIPDIDNYLLPSALVLMFMGAIGLNDLFLKVPARTPLIANLTILLVAWGLIVNWQAQNNSKNYAALDGVHNYYKSVVPPALIMCANWDFESPWFYSHFYLKEQPQVLMIDKELLRRSWYYDWVKQVDPKLFDYIKPEYEDFLPQVKLFEAGLPYGGEAIEAAYEALLKKITTYEGYRFYFDPSVQLKFHLGGQIRVSGELFQLLKPGEIFEASAGGYTPPRFGKPQSALDWREKWHLQLFRDMNAGPQNGVGR